MTASARTARREVRRRRLRAAIATGRIPSPLEPRLLPVTRSTAGDEPAGDVHTLTPGEI
ncbi:hypothetical protein [Nocardioides sp. CER19]|uniref:hypothetical protein n=1 Tax=Nocardioides sp. CER19 TaxID=3038538 RepID=UPI00244BB191|nr:hypothetical protein [Nocardioides sp. CER19]MDH2414415.1 hypothetical protein [Nocardioides sp. CER19]